MDRQEDAVLFQKIKLGDEKSFELLFRRYYGHLCLYAVRFTQNNPEAEEIVQDLFAKIWEKKEQLTISTSVKNYLFRSVKNHCLNFLQHSQIKNQYSQKVCSEANDLKESEDTNYIEIDMLRKIEESIQALPEKRRKIFRLSRQEGLKYREIAEKLGISIKTVETQMGLAIKTLREKLKDFLPAF
jgi:RNA polymerase sigma-70 factor (ECF subfamily)